MKPSGIDLCNQNRYRCWEQVALGVSETAAHRFDFAFDLIGDLVESSAQRIEVALGLFPLGFGKEAELLGPLCRQLVEVSGDLLSQVAEHAAHGVGLCCGTLGQLAALRVLDGLRAAVQCPGETGRDHAFPPANDLFEPLWPDGCISGRAEQGVEVAKGVDPSKTPASQPAPGNDQLLVKAVAVHAGDDETGMANHADVAGLEDIGNRCDRSGRDTCQALVLTSCPDLGAQQAQGLGDQAVTEVAEDDVVAGCRRGSCRR